MIYKKLVRRAEKRLTYIIDEALTIPVTDISWVLEVISDEFAIKTGINIDSWINGLYSITYSSNNQDYYAVNAIIRDEKPPDGNWFGPKDTLFYKTFGTTPFGSFSILMHWSEQDPQKKKKALEYLAIRIFSKLQIWFHIRDLSNQHNYFKLPDPFYYNSPDFGFCYYRGALYLRLEDADELYQYEYGPILGYEKTPLRDNYNSWMGYFDDSDHYSLAFDAGCLVVLLKGEDSSLPYFEACRYINQIEESASSESEKPLWAICYYDENPITMKILSELRLKVLSGISGYKHYLSFGGDEEIDYGIKKELPEVPPYDYWDEKEDEIWENSRKPKEPILEDINPFEDFFTQ